MLRSNWRTTPRRFETAKPYGGCAATDDDDLETMRSLRDIYARTGDDDKMLELTAKIKAASTDSE